MAEIGDIVSRLGPRIRAEREALDLSAADLCARAGIGRATLTGLEQSARTPSLETLAKIADALGVRISDLLDDQIADRPVESSVAQEGTDLRPLAVWTEGGMQVEVYRLRISTAIRRKASQRGARGYVTVVAGALTAGSAATPRKLTVGGQLAFAVDQPHQFVPTGGPAEVVLVMRYPKPAQAG